MDEDDSGYVIDADAAEMITSFMIQSYLESTEPQNASNIKRAVPIVQIMRCGA